MKIAIECANEREHMALMRHMESKGWVHKSEEKPLNKKYSSINRCVQYSNNFNFWPSSAYVCNHGTDYKELGYLLIPFAIFAELMQIDLPRYTFDANKLDVSGVDSLTYEQVCEVAKLMGEMRNA